MKQEARAGGFIRAVSLRDPALFINVTLPPESAASLWELFGFCQVWSPRPGCRAPGGSYSAGSATRLRPEASTTDDKLQE